MADRLDEGALVAVAATVLLILVLAYRFTTGGRKRSFQQTVAEVEESTPLALRGEGGPRGWAIPTLRVHTCRPGRSRR
jgi:hypothetical protein